jgi:2-oxoglutarate ferredoxin oxidoreductase subunit alpha
VERIVSVEHNATGQFATLAAAHGVVPARRVLRYDGRPFSVEEMERELKGVIG